MSKISSEEYKKISKQTIDRGEEGLYNFILNLNGKNMNSFTEFCEKMIGKVDYNNIKRDDELFELLLKAGNKYEIYILTNNYKTHLDKVYSKLFGKSLKEFPFKSYDITSTFKDVKFHPKQNVDGLPNFLKIIRKNYECIICDDDKRNINKCIELNIPYEHITYKNSLKKVLNKLIK